MFLLASHDEHRLTDILTSGLKPRSRLPGLMRNQWLRESVARYSGVTVPDSHGVPRRLAVLKTDNGSISFKERFVHTSLAQPCQGKISLLHANGAVVAVRPNADALQDLVGATGVEPARIAPKDPKSFASADSATRPDCQRIFALAATTVNTFSSNVAGLILNLPGRLVRLRLGSACAEPVHARN